MNFFITKNFTKKIDRKSNLILSPEFYWVKRVSLDVRFSSEVKKLSKSIFESSLPDGDFEYRVFKVAKKEYIVAAYDLKAIKKELENLAIQKQFIGKIYLAQSEFSYGGLSLLVDNDYGISSSDSVVVYIPKELLENSVNIEDVCKDKKLSSKYIYSSSFDSAKFNQKWLNFFLLISLLCSFIFLVNIARLKQKLHAIEKRKSTVVSSYSLPKSSFEIKSLLREIQNTNSISEDFRGAIKYLSSFSLQKGEHFKYLEYKKEKIVCKVRFKSKINKDKFKRYISKDRNSSIKIELLP